MPELLLDFGDLSDQGDKATNRLRRRCGNVNLDSRRVWCAKLSAAGLGGEQLVGGSRSADRRPTQRLPLQLPLPWAGKTSPAWAPVRASAGRAHSDLSEH